MAIDENPPVAADDAGDDFATNKNAATTLAPLANDSDPENAPITLGEINGAAVAAGQMISLQSGATLLVNADGTVGYDPNGAFDNLGENDSATDSFAYRALQEAQSGIGDGGAFALSSLDGSAGFRIVGSERFGYSGADVSGAGDVNGDGIEDLVVSVFGADGGRGESYVVFGSDQAFGLSGGDLALSDIDGANGFRIDGAAAGDRAGWSLSGAGDVNGDGIDDLIIGAYGVAEYAGASYVVFGDDQGFGLTDGALSLAALDGSNGFRIDGVEANDFSGSVSGAGDVNGDGIDDIVIGAFNVSRGNTFSTGESYVVFGSDQGFDLDDGALSLASLDGSNGFSLAGVDAEDFSGFAVSGAGDVNGDGVDDLIIGAWGASSPIGRGESYVVFGDDQGSASTVSLASIGGADGFRLDGAASYDYSGFSVSGAGDVNGDGLDDVIIGAWGAGPGGEDDAGQSYVVFGSTQNRGVVNLGGLNGSEGFRLDGVETGDFSGWSVSAAGDVNGDGVDDLIIGAYSGAERAGESYVVFGDRDGFGASLALADLDGADGFKLSGVAAGDYSGFSVSAAGDVNGDGIDDLVIGAPKASPGGNTYAGESYVVFGAADIAERLSNEATVTVTISGAVAAVSATDDDGFSTPTLQTAFIRFETLLANDPNPETLEIVGFDMPHPVIEGGFLSAEGALFTLWNDTAPVTDIAEATQILYGPPPADGVFTGADSFGYIVQGPGGTATATVSLTVAPDVVEDRDTTDDLIDGTELSERIYGEFGDDGIQAGGGDDIVFGFVGDDVIFGGDGRDRLDGELGNDTLIGGAEIDYLYGDGFSAPGVPNGAPDGADLDDILYGGGGLDALFGGFGDDIFVLTNSSDEEQVFDWNEGDRIAVEGASSLADLTITIDGGTNNVRVILAGSDGSDSMLIVTADGIPELDAGDFDFDFDFSQLTPIA